MVLKEGLNVFDPLLKEEVFIPVSKKKKNLSFWDQGERGGDGNIFEHFGLR